MVGRKQGDVPSINAYPDQWRQPVCIFSPDAGEPVTVLCLTSLKEASAHVDGSDTVIGRVIPALIAFEDMILSYPQQASSPLAHVPVHVEDLPSFARETGLWWIPGV